MLHQAFDKAKGILERIEASGYKAYIVGGAVRDLIIGRDIGDIDITTSANPSTIQDIFEKVIPVGIEHGTVVVRYQSESFEVTTFRTEGLYSDYRHPDEVQFIDNIEEDLARRDFTINAIAMDKHGNIVDPFNGQLDIQDRIIRTVGKPEQRFKEDPLRMVRALRFVSQLGFSVESETRTALIHHMNWMGKIAIERTVTELEKLIAGRYVTKGIDLLMEAEMLDYLPVFKDNSNVGDRLGNIFMPLHAMDELIAMLYISERTIPLEKWVKEWKLSNQTKNKALHLTKMFDYYKENKIDRWLSYSLDEELSSGFARLITVFFNVPQEITTKTIAEYRLNLPITNRKELNISGRDILALKPNEPKGPWINQCLKELEENVVNGFINNTKSELREWVKHWIPPESN